jgi:hypothetical protein
MIEPIDPKIERVIHMAERLIEALEADITALENGKPAEMRTTHPEIQKLSAIYGKEAAGISLDAAKEASAPLRANLLAVTKRFAEVLSRHSRILVRVKNASEGMIRAIAEEVDRKNASTRTYGAQPAAVPKQPGAMIFNGVV